MLSPSSPSDLPAGAYFLYASDHLYQTGRFNCSFGGCVTATSPTMATTSPLESDKMTLEWVDETDDHAAGVTISGTTSSGGSAYLRRDGSTLLVTDDESEATIWAPYVSDSDIVPGSCMINGAAAPGFSFIDAASISDIGPDYGAWFLQLYGESPVLDWHSTVVASVQWHNLMLEAPIVDQVEDAITWSPVQAPSVEVADMPETEFPIVLGHGESRAMGTNSSSLPGNAILVNATDAPTITYTSNESALDITVSGHGYLMGAQSASYSASVVISTDSVQYAGGWEPVDVGSGFMLHLVGSLCYLGLSMDGTTLALVPMDARYSYISQSLVWSLIEQVPASAIERWRHSVVWYSAANSDFRLGTPDVGAGGHVGVLQVSGAAGTGYGWQTWTDRTDGISDTATLTTVGYTATAESATEGAQVLLAEQTDDEATDALKVWDLIRHDDGTEIRLHGTRLVITVGETAGSAVSSEALCYLTEYEGASNQLWSPRVAAFPRGWYRIRPAADPTLALGIVGYSTANGDPIAMTAVNDSDVTQQREILPDSETDLSVVVLYESPRTRPDGVQLIIDDLSHGSSTDGGRLAQWRRDEYWAGVRNQNQKYSVAATSDANAWSLPSGGDYIARRIQSTYASAHVFDAFGTGSSIANAICMMTSSSDTSSANARQYWLFTPTNLYDDTMQAPGDMRLLVTYSDGTSEILDEFGDIQDGDITVAPIFRCDGAAFTASVRVRYLDAEGASWGDWEIAEVPASANSEALLANGAPIPYWGEAWVPNCWAVSYGQSGAKTLSSGVDISGGPFYGRDDAMACEISLSLRQFAYDDENRPTNGPAATVNTIVIRRPGFSCDAAFSGPSGLAFAYSVTNWVPGMVIELTSPGIATSVSADLTSASGTFVIPWTDLENLDPAWLQGGASVPFDYTLTSPYARHTGTVSVVISPEAVFSPGSLSISEHGLYATLSPSGAGDDAELFIVDDTETGRRIHRIMRAGEKFVATPGWIDPSGLVTDSTSAQVFGFSAMSGSYSTYIGTLSKQARGCTTLAYSDGETVRIVPIAGNEGGSLSISHATTSVRAYGARLMTAGAAPGYATSLSISGSLYRGQYGARDVSSYDSEVSVVTGIRDVLSIPANTVMTYRAPNGAVRLVLIDKLDAPMSPTEISISADLIEVG